MRKRLSREELVALWENPAHWTIWSYRCKADPRLLVRKRPPGIGLTLNAAHFFALPALAFMLLLAFGPAAFVISMEGFPFFQLHFFVAIGISAVLLLLFCLIFGRKA